MSPADLPPFDEHGNLHPAFVSHIDQARAKTRDDVAKLAKRFRDHAATHDGDTMCAHALTACTLAAFRSPLNIADLAASAIGRIVELEQTLAMYQAAEQERADRNA